MKESIIILLLISLNCFSAGNSRIREDKTCKQQDSTNDYQSIEISFRADLIEECEDAYAPEKLSCREVPEYLGIEYIACFDYIDEEVNIPTASGRVIKNMKRLIKVDDTGDCRFTSVRISEKLSCSNFHLLPKRKGRASNPMIRDTDLVSCENSGSKGTSTNEVKSFFGKIQQLIE